MEIRLEKNDKELTIFLLGNLDATNAPQLELKVNNELSKVNKVIIDVNDLEYISSAGLRVILKIKKEVEDTFVINASPEVYDIFEMTGFSEMMTVSKKFREISVEGCEIIGRGYYGTVYRINKDTIVKVYSNEMDLDGIKKERELARKAFVLGVPTAISYDVVKVGDQYGSVFELLDAKTLQKCIIEDMDNIDKYIEDYVRVLKVIHSSEAKPGELTNKKEEAIEWAKSVANYIDKSSGAKLIKLLKGIKDDCHMIHGDYHIKNIMMQNNEPFIIDMDTLAVGSPIFEIGFMYACYCGYQEIEKDNAFDFFGLYQDKLDYIFYKSVDDYFAGKSKEYINEIIIKARIICYTQLLYKFGLKDDHKQEFELFKKEIVELLQQVDDLNI